MMEVAILTVLASTAMSAPATDEVKSLPGWSGPLPSKHYSGVLDASPTDHLHYVFVEAAVNPATAPVRLRPFLPLCLSEALSEDHSTAAMLQNVATSTAFLSRASLITFTVSTQSKPRQTAQVGHSTGFRTLQPECNVNCVSFMYLSHHHLQSTQSKPRQREQHKCAT